jgi:hypothetical protein
VIEGEEAAVTVIGVEVIVSEGVRVSSAVKV